MFLHLFVEILHAERDSVKPQFTKLTQLLGADGAGVDLHGYFRIRGQLERVQDGVLNALDLIDGKIGWTASAPMDLSQGSLALDGCSGRTNVTHQGQDVAFRILGGSSACLSLDHAIARTELAQCFAIRDVQVKRKVVAGRLAMAVLIQGRRLFGVHLMPPRWHGIGHVPRQGKSGIASKNLKIDFVRCGDHGRRPSNTLPATGRPGGPKISDRPVPADTSSTGASRTVPQTISPIGSH